MKEAAKLAVSEGVQIVMVPIDLIDPNEWNPNELSDVMFNRLVSDMEELGFLQPILLVPKDAGRYRIVDGEHRYEGAKLLDHEKIPAVILSGDFAVDETKQKLQTMRMNMIRGNVDKRKLTALVTDLATSMPLEEVAEGMAYDDVDGLRALIEDTRASLPVEMRKEFDKAREEIKTVDDLSLVLNRLFTKYGSTLPYNYMVLDFGGKEHLWVRLPEKKALERVKQGAAQCRERGVTFSSALLLLLAGMDAEFFTSRREELEVAQDESDSEKSIEQEIQETADGDAGKGTCTLESRLGCA